MCKPRMGCASPGRVCEPRAGCASPGQGVQAQDGMCKPRAGCASPGRGSTHGPLRAAPLTAPLPCRLPATMSLPSEDHTVSTCPLCVCSQRALRGSLLPPPGPPAGLQGEACPGGRTCRPPRPPRPPRPQVVPAQSSAKPAQRPAGPCSGLCRPPAANAPMGEAVPWRRTRLPQGHGHRGYASHLGLSPRALSPPGDSAQPL